MDQKYFWKEVLPKTTREQIIGGYSAAYFSAVITLIAAFFLNPSFIVDAIIVLLLGLGIHLGKSRTCAIVITLYFVWRKISMFASGVGSLNVTSLLFILLFTISILGTFKYHKIRKEYLQNAARPIPPVDTSSRN